MKTSYKISLGAAIIASTSIVALAASGLFVSSSNILLGNSNIEPWGYSLEAGKPEAFKMKSSKTGVIGTFHLWIGTSNTATSVNIGLYSESEGHAGSLITSGMISSPKKGEWNEVSVKTTNKIENGITYWLAILGQGGILRYRDSHQPCNSGTNVQSNLTSLPQTWESAKVYPECEISAYITQGEEEIITTPIETISTTTEEISPKQTNCINIPNICGYPDSTNSGVLPNSTLQKSGSLTISSSGTTIKNQLVSGDITINANNTTIENVELAAGSGSGNRGVYVPSNITGTVFKNFTCHGSGSGIQYCIINHNSSTKIIDSYLYNCAECLNGPGRIENSIFNVTAKISGEHYEDIYYGGGEGPLIINHDTMLNPEGQTATIFASNDFGNQTTLEITNNLLAGGGYTIYGGGSCTTGGCGKVLGPITITNNRFSNKYYKNGGYYGIDAYTVPSVTKWAGNYWDSTLKPIEE